MAGIPLHRVVEGREVLVGDFVLVDDEAGWRKVNDVILSPQKAILKYDGGADTLGLEEFVSVLRSESVTSREVC